MTLLNVCDLSHHYAHGGFSGKHQHQAVLNNVSLTLKSGETVALLGRSGCGKSTLARLLVGLESPSQGNISWRGESLAKLNRAQRKAFRRDIQMVFQDSISAVNPRKTVREILREPMRHLLSLKKAEQLARASEMLKAVDLDDSVLDKRPPQLSGGQLQRVCLARALAVEPKLLILDEAVSNLDLVLQAGVIRLLKKLQQQFGTACLFITHDLRLVERFCQRVMVMDNGQIVETQVVGDKLTFPLTPDVCYKTRYYPHTPCAVAPQKRFKSMQRVTITLDDDLLETLDSLSQRRGYNNRSEAIRDILRSALAQEATQQHGTQGFAVLSYVYEHEKRDLASRIVSTQHHHHDLSVATLHVHINHDDCLEIAVLKGDMGDVQHFADDVIAQRGVRHGHLQCLPKED